MHFPFYQVLIKNGNGFILIIGSLIKGSIINDDFILIDAENLDKKVEQIVLNGLVVQKTIGDIK